MLPLVAEFAEFADIADVTERIASGSAGIMTQTPTTGATRGKGRLS
jgi:hypothetical protein